MSNEKKSKQQKMVQYVAIGIIIFFTTSIFAAFVLR